MAEWENSLFGCFGNIGVCIITFLCPCYTQGKIGGATGSSCLVCGILQLIPLVNLLCATSLRGKVREQKGIEGGLLGDFLAMWCCYFCGLCQAAKESGAMGGQALDMDRK